MVADELGALYNKDALLAALMARSLPAALGHVSSLRHLIDLRLARNPNYAGQSAASAADFQPGNGAEWTCPVTGLELNGRYRFVALRRTGHVVSEKALKEVGPCGAPLLTLFSSPITPENSDLGLLYPLHDRVSYSHKMQKNILAGSCMLLRFRYKAHFKHKT